MTNSQVSEGYKVAIFYKLLTGQNSDLETPGNTMSGTTDPY